MPQLNIYVPKQFSEELDELIKVMNAENKSAAIRTAVTEYTTYLKNKKRLRNFGEFQRLVTKADLK